MTNQLASTRLAPAAAAAALLVCLALVASSRLQAPALSLDSESGVSGGMTALPLSFEPNAGRMDQRVDFVARTGAGSAYLTSAGARLALTDHAADGREARSVDLELLGGAKVEPAAHDRLPGQVNDLRGDDPARWERGIPTFERVRYPGVYPGVDLDWHGNSQALEFDFRLAPGADSKRIAFRVKGADSLRLAANGDLLIRVGGETLRQAAPVAYQRTGSGRTEVPARFQLRGKSVSFSLGAYDQSRPLVVDPVVLDYSTYLGGNGADRANAIAVDSSGAAYLTGRTLSTDFDTSGPVEGDEADADAFVSKLNPAGDAIAYSTYLGGNGDDSGNGIAVDDSGAYLVGTTESTDFNTVNTPPDPPHTQPGFSRDPDYSNTADAFVAKLNPSGSGLLYSTYLGGKADSNACSYHENKTPGADYGNAIAVDGAGSAYVTGTTYANDFPVQGEYEGDTEESEKFGSSTSQNCSLTGPSSLRSDAFVTKLAPAGNALAYSTYIGGNYGDGATAIAVDGAGSVFVAGATNSDDFDIEGEIEGHSGPYTENGSEASASAFDAFVTKLNPTGDDLDYSTYLGGTDYDAAHGIAIDSDGAAYVSGVTQSSDFDTKDEVETDSPGPDAFVSKLNATGDGLDYSTYLGGGREDIANSIAVDSTGRAFVTGTTASRDFDLAGEIEGDSGGDDAFVSSLTPSGELSCSTYLGGEGDDASNAIALDADDSAHIAGTTESSDFDTAGPIDDDDPPGSDAFASKLSLEEPCEPHTQPAGSQAARDDLQVYVVVLDGLRPQEIGPALTPQLDELKQNGTWYEEARSVFLAETLPNHAAMMTGITPQRSGLVGNDYWIRPNPAIPGLCGQYPCRMLDPALLDVPTLPTTLEESCDVSTAVVQSKGYLWHLFGGEAPNPDDPDPQRRADYVWSPTSSDAFIGKPDDHTVDASVMKDGFMPWLQSAPADPRFAFLNLGDIDRSGHVDQSGATVPAGGLSAFRQTALTETDTQVRLFIDELKNTGAWDDSVLIFTSDHGMDWSTADHDTSLGLAPTTTSVSVMPGVRKMISGGGTTMYYLAPGTDPEPIADTLASIEGIETVATREPGLGYPTLDDLGLDHPNTGEVVALNAPGWKDGGNIQGNPIPGSHGHAVTQHSTLFVTGGHPALADDPQIVPGEKVYDPANGVYFRRPDGGPGNLSIAPTVAKLFGLQPPDGGYDGSPLDAAFDDWAFEPHAPCHASSPPGALSIGDITVSEGNSGQTNANFTVSLSAPSTREIKVDYRTEDGTATAPSDYESRGPTTLTFDPGESEKQVSVPVKGDQVDEPDETFTVELSAEVGAELATATGTATITDDDATPQLSIDDRGVSEGDDGTNSANFTVSLSGASQSPIQVGFATADGTATPSDDYESQSGTVSFAPLDTAPKAVSIVVNGDTLDETNETFFVDLSAAQNAGIAKSRGTGTILDDDGPPDADGDLVPDSTDGCPNQAGPPANGGCPIPTPTDQDGDGVFDASDSCPAQTGPAANGGCPLPDRPKGARATCTAQVAGTAGNDTLTGTPAGDLLQGLLGADQLLGMAGDDCLFGGPGRDALSGEAGSDLLRGGDGRDLVRGGADNDVISGGRGRDALSGGSGDDRIRAYDRGRDRIRCGTGEDEVIANVVDQVSASCEEVGRPG